MAPKRLRGEFESDLQTTHRPLVLYGTSLLPVNSGTQDDGSYVPIWKQEVKDERGRKRLHGAFTGGYSAGYFNTVGSKEGWTPSSFTSSRSKKRTKEHVDEHERRAQYMDDEDLADAAEAQMLSFSNEFQGIGVTSGGQSRRDFGLGRLSPAESNMGLRLLRKMSAQNPQSTWSDGNESTHAQENSINPASHRANPGRMRIFTLPHQANQRGLGAAHDGLMKKLSVDELHGHERNPVGPISSIRKASKPTLNTKASKEGSNSAESYDRDPDEDDDAMGPRISYNGVAAASHKSKRIALQDSSSPRLANPLLRSRMLYRSSKRSTRTSSPQGGKHGPMSLDGFTWTGALDISNDASIDGTAPALPIAPEGWTPAGISKDMDSYDNETIGGPVKAPRLDPGQRANMLGETILKGKSVFDYISPLSRDRLAKVIGREDLPAGRGEVPIKSHGQLDVSGATLPSLDKETAQAALGRGIGGWMPYAENEAKRARYKYFMEFCAGIKAQMPKETPDMTRDSFLHELHEFARAAAVFKPMTGIMASKFSSPSLSSGSGAGRDTIQNPTSMSKVQPHSAAEAAARLGMFGPLTRHSTRLFPPRLVCKRFGIAPPAQAQDDGADEITSHGQGLNHPITPSSNLRFKPSSGDMGQKGDEATGQHFGVAAKERAIEVAPATTDTSEVVPIRTKAIDPSHNVAIEAEKAGEALFKAVFGDDSDSN